VARAWGFRPISEIVWLKRYPSGSARIGTGYRVRTMHEPILVCTVGNPQHKPFRSTFDGIAREHSRKPDEFYDLVLSYTPQAFRRADLFSRQSRPGFEGWGNEHGNFDESRHCSVLIERRSHHSTQRFKSTLTAGHYFDDGTVGTDPPLRPGPWRVRNRVVPVPRRGFRLV
jgi:N6-adenosine-specific RNA methylase IME4